VVNLPLVWAAFPQFLVKVAVVEHSQIRLLLPALPQTDGKRLWGAVLHSRAKAQLQRLLIRGHQRRDSTLREQAQNGGIHRLRAGELTAGYAELGLVFHNALPFLIAF